MLERPLCYGALGTKIFEHQEHGACMCNNSSGVNYQ